MNKKETDPVVLEARRLRINERSRQWYANNKEVHTMRVLRWRDENKAAFRLYQNAYNKEVYWKKKSLLAQVARDEDDVIGNEE